VTSFWDGITPQDEQTSLDHVASMLSGTKALADQPGLVYALGAQGTKNADAQAIDQFMQALNGEKQVRLAQATGQKLLLDDDTKHRLTAAGIDYSSVEQTPQNVAQNTISDIEQQSGGKQTAKVNPDGSLALDAHGNVQLQDVAQEHKGGGGPWHHLVHDLGNWTVKPVLGGLNKAWNVTDVGLTDVAQHIGATGSDLLHGDITGALANAAESNPIAVGLDMYHPSDDRKADMRAQGYDPGSPFSFLAYSASGKARNGVSGLEAEYGQDKVRRATDFLNDPTAARSKIESDPASYITTGDNQTVLTPKAKAELEYYNSKEFVTLARKLNASTATIGNQVMKQSGVDPVDHPEAFTLGSGAIDLAASMLADPTLMAGKVFKVYKLSQVGMSTAADSERIAAVLDPAAQAARANALMSKAMIPGSTEAQQAVAHAAQQAAQNVKSGIFTSALQRRTQNFIDTAHQMADAHKAGDTVKAASLSARISAQFPEWAPLTPDVIGSNKIVSGLAGSKTAVYGTGEGIHSLGEMADYIASKGATVRLMNGRAAVESSYMPGAVSHFGLRALHGSAAEWMTARSAVRSEKAQQVLLNSAAHDPARAEKLLNDKLIEKIMPSATDAADAYSRETIASPEAAKAFDQALGEQTGPASQYRLTPAGRGQAVYNMRRYGAHGWGWATPSAVAARGRLAAQRLSTLLPRNTLININDADAEDKIYKLAMTYLNRGDANTIRSAWNVGDGGQRKAIIGGLIDQLGHAAGLGRTSTGRDILESAKTHLESYSSTGDEAIYNGQNLALSPGQVRQAWLLPTFQALHTAANKFGLWEATMGRALTSRQSDTLMSYWKLGALFKPSTVTRNQLEAWLKTSLDGRLGDAVKAKAFATMRKSELWERGLDQAGKATYDTLVHEGNLEEADRLANTTMLGGSALGRSRFSDRVASFAPFALAGRAYRAMAGKAMSPELLEDLSTLGPQELSEAMLGYSQRIKEGDLGLRNAARQSTDVSDAGFGPSRISHALQRARLKGFKRTKGESTSWTMQEAANAVGAERYAHALGMRVNASPGVFHAVMDTLEKPNEFDISHVVEALDHPGVASKMHLTGYGSVWWPDGSKEAIDAVTPEQVLLGKQEWARKLSGDYKYLLTGRNGEYVKPLADHIRETGEAPNADWLIDNLSNDTRPEAVLAPDIEAVPASGKPDGLVGALQDVLGAGYEWFVERPLQRTTSSPIFLANYAVARNSLRPMVDQLVAEGLSHEAASEAVKEVSVRNAWVKTEQIIDDPGQKSQFDVVARNMFPFSRATQAMIRRWGGSLWQDPTRARRMMLAYEGGVHSGLIYTNAYGEPTFTYPGSGVMNGALRDLAKVPGFQGLAHFPVSASMTGGVLMSVPGADNPFRMSAGPMVMIPLREAAKLLPGDSRVMFDEIDSAINGPIGVGQTFSTLQPALFRKFYTNLSTNDRNSAMASSMMGAFANLAAAGMVPKPDDPPSAVEDFRRNLQTQTRSQLFLRAVFGLFAPAAPSGPSEGTAASGADYQFQIQGIKQLSDEYKAILNEAGGEVARANAIWTALHPDQVVYKTDGTTESGKYFSVYEIPKSQATTSKVALPSTSDSLKWMIDNRGFIKQYGAVSAYFLPEATTAQPFSDQAYRAQLELGLRQRKAPNEFMDDLYVRNAEAIYYPSLQQLDAKIADAQAKGDSAGASQWRAQKSAWEADFKERYRNFAAKLDSSGDAAGQAIGQLADLRKMVASNHVPDGQGPLLKMLITSYDNYVRFNQDHRGGTDVDTSARSNALAGMDQWAATHIQGTPLMDLYNGVFRELNSNLAKLGGVSSGV
jgi:hypothetical protein